MTARQEPTAPERDAKKQIETRPKRPVGRPRKLILRIEDTPQNIARSLFGIKSDKYSPKDNQE